jgi:peptidyl-prolyl cis-trans isomerase B (cyclophilin B)
MINLMKNIINPSAILYVFIIIIITLAIGYASKSSSGVGTREVKTINQNNMISTSTKSQLVSLETSLGNIELELYPEKAPITVANFVKLAKEGVYDNTKFHRVIKGFMIQGGDPYTKGDDVSMYGTGGPGYTILDEANSEIMARGVLAMANTGRPNTGGSQFFITTADTSWLQGKHTIFGKVISGMEIVDKIENVKTTGEPYNRPITPVVLNKIIVK